MAENGCCTGQRITSTCLPMGFNLPGSTHHETCQGVAEVAVLGKVVGGSASSGDDGDRVDVGKMVGGQDGGAGSWDVFNASNFPPQQRSQQGREEHAQSCIDGRLGKRFRTGSDGPVGFKSQPRLFNRRKVAHGWPSPSFVFMLPHISLENTDFPHALRWAKDKRERASTGPDGMGSDTRLVLPCFLIGLILAVVVHPVALAQSAWEEDGWLRTSLGQERLEAGDEFGCYGMPGLSWQNDPGAVAQACKSYIEERLNASIWGVSPLSTYAPPTLTMADHGKIASQGFTVHGDMTALSSTAWHNASDTPVDLWDWYNLGRRGGSLEKGIASLEALQTEVEAGGLVNMYWIGRVNDATVRHDRDVFAYLDETPGIWLTTWGQAWSSWAGKRCYEHTHQMEETANGSVLSFESLETEACRSVSDGLPWNVPLTWLIDVDGADVRSVSTKQSGSELPSIEGEKNSKEGWWQQEDGTLVLSVVNGHHVEIALNNSNVQHDVLSQAEFFNNHSAAVTIAAHETTDLFKWSKRFVEESDVRFTWLVQPRPAEGQDAWIPYAIVGVGVLTTFLMLAVLGREGLGPLSRLAGEGPLHNQQHQVMNRRSLDADEEA